MRVRIYQPARSAMQSGTARTKSWVLDFPPADQPKTQTPQQAEQQKKQQQQRAAQADTHGLVSGGNASMSAE